MALGAQRRDVVRLVLGQMTRVVALATAAGLSGSWLLGGSIRALLFEVTPGDPATIATAVSALAGSALVAAYIPVRRALAQNPLASLRAE
jgi:putative ABC transport system permease protein